MLNHQKQQLTIFDTGPRLMKISALTYNIYWNRTWDCLCAFSLSSTQLTRKNNKFKFFYYKNYHIVENIITNSTKKRQHKRVIINNMQFSQSLLKQNIGSSIWICNYGSRYETWFSPIEQLDVVVLSYEKNLAFAVFGQN